MEFDSGEEEIGCNSHTIYGIHQIGKKIEVRIPMTVSPNMYTRTDYWSKDGRWSKLKGFIGLQNTCVSICHNSLSNIIHIHPCRPHAPPQIVNFLLSVQLRILLILTTWFMFSWEEKLQEMNYKSATALKLMNMLRHLWRSPRVSCRSLQHVRRECWFKSANYCISFVTSISQLDESRWISNFIGCWFWWTDQRWYMAVYLKTLVIMEGTVEIDKGQKDVV